MPRMRPHRPYVSRGMRPYHRPVSPDGMPPVVPRRRFPRQPLGCCSLVVFLPAFALMAAALIYWF